MVWKVTGTYDLMEDDGRRPILGNTDTTDPETLGGRNTTTFGCNYPPRPAI
jgi:hypothetical protein